MNLNRNNYEEFFLMYVDDELNTTQKNAVDNFVLNNPDLQQELNLLLQTKLISVSGTNYTINKTSLYKNELTAVTSNNYQEKFLLYVDNELTAIEKLAVETYVLQHPEKQIDFTTLKNTKLPQQIIECPNKQQLYKNEKTPIVYGWFKKAVSVAAVLLLAIMAWVLYPKNNNTTTPENAAVNVNKPNPKTNNLIPKQVVQQNTVATNTNNNKSTASNNTENHNNLKQVLPQSTVATNTNNNSQKITNNNPTITVQTPNTITNNTPSQQQVIANNNTVKEDRKEIQLLQEQQNNNKTISQTQNTVPTSNIASINTQTIVYKMLDDTDDEQTSQSKDQSVYIGNMQVSKSKLKSLFKKAKKTITNAKNEI